MEEDKMMKPMIMGIGAFAGLMIMVGVMGMYAPPVYTCPICGAQFTSMEDMEAHFTSEHPAEPIDIIWQ